MLSLGGHSIKSPADVGNGQAASCGEGKRRIFNAAKAGTEKSGVRNALEMTSYARP